MAAVVSVVFQEYVPPPDAVNVAFCPEQTEVLAVIIFTAGVELTVTFILVVEVQSPFETVTE